MRKTTNDELKKAICIGTFQRDTKDPTYLAQRDIAGYLTRDAYGNTLLWNDAKTTYRIIIGY